MPDKKPAPNFLTCPIEPAPSATTAPAPKQVPMEDRSADKQDRVSTSPVAQVRTSPLAAAMPAKKTIEPSVVAPRKKSRKGLVVFLLVLALCLAASPGVYAFVRAGLAARSAKASLDRAAAALKTQNIQGASQHIVQAEGELAAARDALKLAGFWRDIPGLGTQIHALENAADAGAKTADGVGDLLNVAGDLMEAVELGAEATGGIENPVENHRSFKDLSPDEKYAILARLDRKLPDIRAAQAKVAVALETWNRIPQNELYAPFRTALQPVAQELPRLKQSLDEVVPLLEVFIPLAGYPKPSQYLVLLQNSEEMRATGGFLGTWGILQMDGGDLKQFSFNDVYSLDNPVSAKWKETPPPAIPRYLGVPVWYFRDANWSPDFPVTADKLSDFYVRETKLGTGKDVPRPDGVIALNAPFFQGLLRMTGPITIDGITFDTNNFFDVLEFEVEEGFLQKGVSIDQRKQILIKLGDALLAKISSLPSSRWPDLLDLATNALNHKQIQVYAREPSLLSRLDAFGWTGRTKATDGDFLWVIDTNLAALKTDGVMTKRVNYHVDAADPTHPVATVTLRYTNNAPGFAEYRYTRYRDYVRLYVPEGSELIEVKGAMKDDRYKTGGRVVAGPVDVYKDLGKTVYGAFWSIEPKQTQEITFRYRLPAGIGTKLEEGRYHLDFPKQSGNDETTLTLDLRFGKKLQRATPPEDSTQFGDTNYRLETDSAVDRVFEMVF